MRWPYVFHGALIAIGFSAAYKASKSVKPKIKEMAAVAALFSDGLLAGSTSDAQAQCDPPIYDVCFYKDSRSSSPSGDSELGIEFDGLSGKQHEVIWNGLKNWGTAVRIVTRLLMILSARKEFPGVRQLITTNFSGILTIRTTVTTVPFTKGIGIGTAEGC